MKKIPLNDTCWPGPLSCMHTFSGFLYEGIYYRSVETFFVDMKAADRTLRPKIAAKNPFEAKKFGKQIRLRSDWLAIRDDVMAYALARKFKYDANFRDALMKTAVPIHHENNWHDNYWGACICPSCRNAQKVDRLGKLLTALRDRHL